MTTIAEFIALAEEIDIERYQLAAKKMVDNVEKRRKEGKYPPAERAALEKKYFDNIKKMASKKKS